LSYTTQHVKDFQIFIKKKEIYSVEYKKYLSQEILIQIRKQINQRQLQYEPANPFTKPTAKAE